MPTPTKDFDYHRKCLFCHKIQYVFSVRSESKKKKKWKKNKYTTRFLLIFTLFISVFNILFLARIHTVPRVHCTYLISQPSNAVGACTPYHFNIETQKRDSQKDSDREKAKVRKNNDFTFRPNFCPEILSLLQLHTFMSKLYEKSFSHLHTYTSYRTYWLSIFFQILKTNAIIHITFAVTFLND